MRESWNKTNQEYPWRVVEVVLEAESDPPGQLRLL
jgi:hypothetical protein